MATVLLAGEAMRTGETRTRWFASEKFAGGLHRLIDKHLRKELATSEEEDGKKQTSAS